MLTHVVIFTWKTGVTAKQVEDLAGALDRMVAGLTDLLAVRHGPDLGFRRGNGDYALVMTFADEAAWRRYQASPAHTAVVREAVMPLRSHSRSIQIASRGEHDDVRV